VLNSFYPSAKAEWAAAYEKATAAVAKMSSSEKSNIASGSLLGGRCIGNTAGARSVGYPGLCAQDSPLGIRHVKGVSAMPAGIHAASTWDLDLMKKRGAALGAETKALGIHILLGPVVGPLGKIPTGGRNWEGFSPDPYLTGLAAAETIKGMQAAGAQACVKHFIGNEQEHSRNSISSNIDDRTLHELYLWPFADAVNAGVASVMCSA